MVIFFFIGKTRHDDDVSDELLEGEKRLFSLFVSKREEASSILGFSKEHCTLWHAVQISLGTAEAAKES